MAVCHMSEVFDQHVPVLLTEAINNLVIDPSGTYIDTTFGRGSHSQAILNKLSTNGKLIAFDKDPEAITYAKTHFSKDNRFSIFHTSFSRMSLIVENLNLAGKVQGILFDLGVSSPQLDNPERGFSFTREGSLDMRMDTDHGISAMQFLANVAEADLANVLWQYGEEKNSRRIARAIVETRAMTPITTTVQLAEIIKSVSPKKYEEKHPATRSFQAIRIFINEELSDLEVGLASSLEALMIGGRMAVISFHSLEDRIVKQFIKQHEKGPEIPRGLPIRKQDFTQRLKSIGKPIKPTQMEIEQNIRARSAILRIAEKRS